MQNVGLIFTQLQIDKMKLDLAKQAAANEQLEQGLDQYSEFLKSINMAMTGTEQLSAADVTALKDQINTDQVRCGAFFNF